MKSERHRQKIIEELRRTPIVEIACKNAGVGRTAFYEWLKRNKKFRAQVEDAMLSSRATVTDLAESKLIGKIKEGSFKEIEFWLRNNSSTYMAAGKSRKPVFEEIKPKRPTGFKVVVYHAKGSPTVTKGPIHTAGGAFDLEKPKVDPSRKDTI